MISEKLKMRESSFVAGKANIGVSDKNGKTKAQQSKDTVYDRDPILFDRKMNGQKCGLRSDQQIDNGKKFDHESLAAAKVLSFFNSIKAKINFLIA